MNIGQIINQYEILEKIGEGGMGVVYKALDTRLDRPVAVKVILKQRVPPERWDNFVQRFDREARALAKLSHPNIVSILDYGEFEGRPYLVMEYMPGGSLAEKTGQPIPWRQALEWVIPLAKALGHAHSKGILHRDIKPHNILFTEDGQPKLADFGLAKAMDSSEKSDLSQSTVGIGTAEYMAPEQALGKAVDGRADQYGLAMVLYELVTGRKPFKGNTALEVLLMQVSETLPRPRTFAPGLPESIDAILLKALSKLPDERYQNIAELVRELENTMAGQQPASPERGKGLSALALPVGLIAVFVLAWLLWPKNPPMAPISSTITPTLTRTMVNTPTGTVTSKPEVIPTVTPAVLAARITDAFDVPMALIPAETFSMGITADEALADCQKYRGDCQRNWFTDEEPVHTVILEAFYMDVYEVTNSRYAACVQAGACQPPADKSSSTRSSYFDNPGFADYPVIHVSWDDAQTYCAWRGARLPSEAEWELAARGEDGRIYPWGNELAGQRTNLCDQNCTFEWAFTSIDDGYADTSPVGTYPQGANPFGILDLVGNVWEWVADWYAEDYYAGSPASNPSGPQTGNYHVMRGGSWLSDPYILRSSHRDYGDFDPGNRSDKVGIRCVRSP